MRVTVALLALLALVLSTPLPSAQKTVEELKPLFSIPRVGGARFHPKRNEIMYVSDESGVLQIYSVAVDIATKNVTYPQRLLETNNRCTSPRYLSDGTVLFLHDRGGDENFQIGFIKNNKQHWLTYDRAAKHTVTKVTKRYLYYKSNTLDKSRFDIYRRRLPLDADYKPELIFSPTTGYAQAALTDKAEKRIILAHHHSNVHGEIVLLDLHTNTTRSLTKPISGTKPVRWIPLRFLNKKRTRMLVKTDYNSEYLRLAILKFRKNIKTSEPKFVTIKAMERLPYDVIGLVTNHKTKASYIELNKDGYSELLRVRIGINGFRGDIKKVVLPLKKGVISRGDIRSFGRGMAISRDGKTMVISMSNSATPVDIYMLELNHRSAFVNLDQDDYFRPHYWSLLINWIPRSLATMNFAGEELLQFDSFDGTPIQYFLMKPNTPAPRGGYPTVIRLHGGPESQSRPSFDAINQFIVQNGFALALPNVRGSKGYGRDFLDLDNQEKRLDAIRDVKGVAKDLREEEDINSEKLFIMGGSYGGYATLLSLVTYPELWKGGVSTVGMSSLETFFERTAPWRRKLRYKEYGNYETQRALLKRISPINSVDKLRAPVFFIHGENDERVPVTEATNMYNKIKLVSAKRGDKIGEQSVLLTFPDEGHGITKRENREKTYKMLVNWLNKIAKQ